MPPPDAEKPEGVEMSDDPEERFHQLFDVFFGMHRQGLAEEIGDLQEEQQRIAQHPQEMQEEIRRVEDKLGRIQAEGEMGDGG